MNSLLTEKQKTSTGMFYCVTTNSDYEPAPWPLSYLRNNNIRIKHYCCRGFFFHFEFNLFIRCVGCPILRQRKQFLMSTSKLFGFVCNELYTYHQVSGFRVHSWFFQLIIYELNDECKMTSS